MSDEFREMDFSVERQEGSKLAKNAPAMVQEERFPGRIQRKHGLLDICSRTTVLHPSRAIHLTAVNSLALLL